MYFESRKNASKIFPALLKFQNIFHGYLTTRNKRKNFLVICTLIQPQLEIIFIIYVARHVPFQIYTLATYISNLVGY